MTLRVLHIIPTLVRGGAEKQLALLASRLPRATIDVHVFVLTHDGPYREQLEDAGVPVTLIDKRWKIDPGAYWRLKRQVRRLKPDVAHTWLFAANCYGRQAALATGVKRIVAGERCVDTWKVWHELALDRHYARRTSRIVTNSSGVADFYVRHGIPAEKFHVIPNGIQAQSVQRKTAAEALRAELKLPPESRLIGAVGRLWPQKRYKDLIWAAELLKAVRDDTHLLIVGEGPQEDLLKRYRRLVEIEDRVHFLGRRQNIVELLAGMDCFWLGSGYEGQSNAMMEAMMVGLPVVATDIPGNRDLVLPESTGILVPIGDAAAFARATIRILDDPMFSGRLGDAGLLRMQEHFSVDRMVQRYVDFYLELVACE